MYIIQVITKDQVYGHNTVKYLSNYIDMEYVIALKNAWIFDTIEEAKVYANKLRYNKDGNIVNIIIID